MQKIVQEKKDRTNYENVVLKQFLRYIRLGRKFI